MRFSFVLLQRQKSHLAEFLKGVPIRFSSWDIHFFITQKGGSRGSGLGIGLSRLCSATLEQLLAFGATFCGFSNLEQVLPFRAIFEQNIGLEHISSTKKSTISWKTLHLAHSKSPPSKITLKPLSCFDITMQRGCNILISYMVLDSENAISRASFVQVPSYRSARRQMNHVFCSVRLKSILKFRPYLRATV